MKGLFIAGLIALTAPAFATPHKVYVQPHMFVLNVDRDIQDSSVSGVLGFGGTKLGYEYTAPEHVYVGVDLISAYSNSGLDVRGFVPYNSPSGFMNTEFRVGYPFLSYNLVTTPFIGIGGYGLNSASDDYRFHQYAIYYALGFNLKTSISLRLSMGLNLKLLFSADTRGTLRYGSVETATKVGYRSHEWGCETGMAFTWHLGDLYNWDLGVEPYYARLPGAGLQNLYGTKLLLGYNF